MAYIATEATTVGEVIDHCAEMMLDGVYRQSVTRTRKGEIDRNAAARHAIQMFADLLNEVYCADRDTLLKDIATPKYPKGDTTP